MATSDANYDNDTQSYYVFLFLKSKIKLSLDGTCWCDETKKGYEGVSKRKCGYRDASASRNVLDNDPRELELHKPVVQEYKAN